MIGVLRAEEYYTRLQSGPMLRQLYRIGQFFWAPATFLLGERPLHLVRATYNTARADYDYRIDRMRPNEFDEPQEPIQTLGIRSDERAVILGIKRRPLILISTAAVRWTDAGRSQEDSFLLAPVYSFRGDETKLEYSHTMIERIKGYVYPQFFYLPGWSEGRISEGFVRLDRIQAIHKNLLEHWSLMLSDDARDLLQSWIRVYLGEEPDSVNDILFDYRENAINDLRAKGLLPATST